MVAGLCGLPVLLDQVSVKLFRAAAERLERHDKEDDTEASADHRP